MRWAKSQWERRWERRAVTREFQYTAFDDMPALQDADEGAKRARLSWQPEVEVPGVQQGADAKAEADTGAAQAIN
jgi:hypothetical protein